MAFTLQIVRRIVLVTLASFAWTWADSAHADDADGPDLGDLPITGPSSAPPPSSARYLQYGPGLAAEFVGFLSSPGPMCDSAVKSNGQQEPTCILGSGGGLILRGGVRAGGPWYFGGAYEISKMDANKILRLPILQQLRGEARYYFRPDLQMQPFAGGGLGLAGYGSEFSLTDTFGPLAFLSVGAETQLSQRYVFVVALAYRAILFSKFTDTSGATRPSGIATALGL